MKTTKSILTSLFSIFASLLFGQANNFNASATGPALTCTNGLSVHVDAGNLTENGIIYVNWGDGIPGEYIFTTDAQQPFFDGYYLHQYAVPGDYTVAVSIWSSVTNNYVGSTQILTLAGMNPGFCAYADVAVTAAQQYMNCLVDFTGANGITTTISCASPGYCGGLDPTNFPYTVSINDAWLAYYSYTQATNDQVIANFDNTGNGGQLFFELGGGPATPPPGPSSPAVGIDYQFGIFTAPTESGYLSFYLVCDSSSQEVIEAELTFESFLVPDLTGLNNPVLANNVLTFEVDQSQCCNWITVPFTFPGNTVAGTPLAFTIKVSNSENTDIATCQATVLNSYDPNNKLVSKGQYVDHLVKEELSYLVNFQNEGNYPALNIKVKDTISAHLDLNTFRLLGTSHKASYTIDQATRVVTFSFPMINLVPVSQDEAGSKGYLTYAISELPGLPLNSEIKNTAYIYFDFNPAIITNTTLNINAILGIDETKSEVVKIYPNPASGKIVVEGNGINEIRIFDFTGKTVVRQSSAGVVNISGLPEGIYFTQVTTETGNSVQKLLVGD